jgi:hypothetical protein
MTSHAITSANIRFTIAQVIPTPTKAYYGNIYAIARKTTVAFTTDFAILEKETGQIDKPRPV